LTPREAARTIRSTVPTRPRNNSTNPSAGEQFWRPVLAWSVRHPAPARVAWAALVVFATIWLVFAVVKLLDGDWAPAVYYATTGVAASWAAFTLARLHKRSSAPPTA
jgi:hypothetical protein